MSHIFKISAIFRQPVDISHEIGGKAYAIRFHFVSAIINLAQVCFDVQMDTWFISIVDNSCSQIQFFIAAFAAFIADSFPLVTLHGFRHSEWNTLALNTARIMTCRQ